jgi:hypothetical protein
MTLHSYRPHASGTRSRVDPQVPRWSRMEYEGLWLAVWLVTSLLLTVLYYVLVPFLRRLGAF